MTGAAQWFEPVFVACEKPPSARPLTETQASMLRYICGRMARFEGVPTRVEICRQFGWTSPNSAEDVVKALRDKGYLRLLPRKHMNISIDKAVIEEFSK